MYKYFRNGNCIVIWSSFSDVMRYFDYSVNEAKSLYKQKFNLSDSEPIRKANYNPFNLNTSFL